MKEVKITYIYNIKIVKLRNVDSSQCWKQDKNPFPVMDFIKWNVTLCPTAFRILLLAFVCLCSTTH